MKNFYYSLSFELLNRDTLLTPQLKKYFGDLLAKQQNSEEKGKNYFRKSSIYQKSTQARILDAKLHINSNFLPEELIEKLRSTQSLFGDLLIDYKIEINITERKLFNVNDHKTGQMRMGRHHLILGKKTKDIYCHVEEILVPESELKPLSIFNNKAESNA